MDVLKGECVMHLTSSDVCMYVCMYVFCIMMMMMVGFHSACVTEEEEVMTFGGGEHGQLGHGDKVSE